MRVAVVVLTHNGSAYLPDLFSSLQKTQVDGSWGVIVVDNASTDGTVGAVRNFQLIENRTNLGFAAGNNVGIRKAIHDGAEYVVLLNQDTVVEPHWLSELVRVAESDQNIGAVQARLMLWGKKDIVNSLGNEIHFLGFGYAGGYGERFKIQDSCLPAGRARFKIHEIAYASGAAVLYRTKALNDVGLLDERFFMYHEDLDLGWRLAMRGWKSVLAEDAVVYHKYEFSRSVKKYYFMERNRFLVLLENYRLLTLALLLPALFIMECGVLLSAIYSGWGREKIRSYGYFFHAKHWKALIAKREEKQRTRTSPDRVVTCHFTGSVTSQEVHNPLVHYIGNPFFNLYWQIVRRVIWW